MPTTNASDSQKTGKGRMVQAHRQAPWRIQTQRMVIILIATVLVVSVLWVMLSVTVEAGSAGLEIQGMEDRQEELQRQIASRRTEYAILTSADRMSKRAEDMGFEPVKPENIEYMVMPSFKGRQPAVAARAPTLERQPVLMKPGYTQSLWEWMVESVLSLSEEDGAVIPSMAGGTKP